MRLKVRKLGVSDGAALEKLISEHVDSIEPGLSVIDTRLMLGESTIDLVAQDGAGGLVLIALGTRADETMLLRVVDAYSWCVEYPESLKRRYPHIDVSEDNPPRVMFLMSRLSESFQRKVKQLSFPVIDTVEFHHLDIDGQSTVYFDNIATIRRGFAAAPRSAAAAAPERVVDIAVRPPQFRTEPRREPAPLAASFEPELSAAAAELARAIAGGSDATAELEELPEVEELASPMEEPDAVAESPAPEALSATATSFLYSSDAPVETARVETSAAAESAVTESAAVEAAIDTKIPASEAAKAAKLAQELGIQLPQGRGLTRQWIEFLNQMAAAK